MLSLVIVWLYKRGYAVGMETTHTTKFIAGNTYSCRSMGDYDCVFTFDILSRTAKTVTFTYYNETKRAKINTNSDGQEYILPLGRYSMAPVLYATSAI